jgi:hypothetical protein
MGWWVRFILPRTCRLLLVYKLVLKIGIDNSLNKNTGNRSSTFVGVGPSRHYGLQKKSVQGDKSVCSYRILMDGVI